MNSEEQTDNKTTTNKKQTRNKTKTNEEQNRKEKEGEKEGEREIEIESEYDSSTPNPSYDLTDDELRIEVLVCFFFLQCPCRLFFAV